MRAAERIKQRQEKEKEDQRMREINREIAENTENRETETHALIKGHMFRK